jgi:uncharacterized membrane protein
MPAAYLRARVSAVSPWSWAALALTVVAAALRCYALDAKSLWFDEALSLADSRQTGRMFGSGFHPPLFYTLLHLWIGIFGDSAAALRLISAIPGTLTVPVVYLAGRRLIDERAGLYAAALLSLASLHVEYSQEVRMYALATLFLALATWSLASVIHRGRGRMHWTGCALYAAACTAAVATHYLAAVVVLGQLVGLALAWREARAHLARVVTLGGGMAAFATLTILTLGYGRHLRAAVAFLATTKGTHQQLFTDPAAQALRLPLDLAVQVLPGINLKWLVIAWYRWPAVAIFDLLALVAIVVVIRRTELGLTRRALLSAAALVPLVAITFAVGAGQLRFFVIAAPSLAILVGGGLALLPMRKAGAAAMAAIMATSALATWWYFDPGMDKQPWQWAARVLEEQARPGDVVLVSEPHQILALEYHYRPRPGVEVVAYPEVGGATITEENLVQYFFPLIRNRQRVWMVLTTATASSSDRDRLALRWLGANYRTELQLRTRGYNGDLEVWMFERRLRG